MKETITDYQTREVERTVAFCDVHNCGVTDDESEMLELSVEKEDGTRETRHYCAEHAQGILGLDSDIERIVDGAEIVVEENPMVRLPWEQESDSVSDGYTDILFAPIAMLVGVFAIAEYGEQNAFYDGAAVVMWGLLLYSAIAAAIWWVVL